MHVLAVPKHATHEGPCSDAMPALHDNASTFDAVIGVEAMSMTAKPYAMMPIALMHLKARVCMECAECGMCGGMTV